VGALSWQRGERFVSGTPCRHRGAIIFEHVPHQVEHLERVIHHQHPDATETGPSIERPSKLVIEHPLSSSWQPRPPAPECSGGGLVVRGGTASALSGGAVPHDVLAR